MSKRKVTRRSRKAERPFSPAPALGKTPPTLPARTSGGAPQVSTPRTTLNPEPESTPYRCSKCHLIAVPRGASVPTEGLPDASQLNEKPLWMRCPDEGPRELDLWDPQEPNNQRLRRSFQAGKSWFRLCTRRVRRRRRKPGEKVVEVFYGPACPFRRMLGEAFVEEIIASKGLAKRMDLEQLRHLFWGFHSETTFPVTLAETIGWHLVPVPLSEAKAWIDEIPKWDIPLAIPDMSELWMIAHTLLVAAVGWAQSSSESRRTAIDVPFDLRFSLDVQWDEKREVLQEIQNHLFALSERKGASHKPDYAVWKRRFKCYLLSIYGGGPSSKKIAELVLPGQKHADVTVRKDIQLVTSLLEEEKARCE